MDGEPRRPAGRCFCYCLSNGTHRRHAGFKSRGRSGVGAGFQNPVAPVSRILWHRFPTGANCSVYWTWSIGSSRARCVLDGGQVERW